MQFVSAAAAGGLLAWAYLAVLGTSLFGRRARRTSLLLSIAGFIEATVVVLVSMYVVADGSAERLVAAFLGFAVGRALLGKHFVGAWDSDEPVFRSADEPASPLASPIDRLA